jgi:hypothetical protein
LNHSQTLDYSQIANIIAVNPAVCLRQDFSLQKYAKNQDEQEY